MARRRAPQWAHDILDDWAGDAMTGALEIEYLSGIIKKVFRRDCVVAPADLPFETLGAKPRLLCPDCHIPFARERDYGQKFDCGQCGATWTIWDLRQRQPGASST